MFKDIKKLETVCLHGKAQEMDESSWRSLRDGAAEVEDCKVGEEETEFWREVTGDVSAVEVNGTDDSKGLEREGLNEYSLGRGSEQRVIYLLVRGRAKRAIWCPLQDSIVTTLNYEAAQ